MELLYIVAAAAGAAVAFYFFNSSSATRTPAKPALDASKFQAFELVKKEEISHDTRIFTFALPEPSMRLGLPVGKHIHLRANVNGEEIERKYTPISSDDDLGVFKLCIKVYYANVHPKFPAGGMMTQHLESLNIGDSIDVKGPTGLIHYKGNGLFKVKGKDIQTKSIGLIAGGTGITPCLQVIEHILKNPNDKTNISLIFGNQTEDDILLRERLETLARDNARFNVWYTLDRPPQDWKYSSGFINEEMCSKHLPAAADDTLVLMCGPPPMIKFACIPNLEKLGHAANRMAQF